MGCDIHVHVEVKIKGEWHHYNQPNIRRSYDLYGRMAGVRGDLEPIAKPRGIPKDATWMTKFDFERMRDDAHTASWLSGAEVEKLEVEGLLDSQTDHGYIFGNGFNIKKYPEDYPDGVEDARMVFWFDC
jgi:hypothetical protein